MATINPYLNFDDNCEEAFNFYRSVFGGEFQTMQRFKEMHSEDLPAEEGDKIMHVALPIGGNTILMGSDSPSSMGKVNRGNNVHIAIQTTSDAESDQIFSGLSAGGQVIMPLEQAPWGARYGAFVDKYGVHWMINQANNNGND